MAEMKMNTLLAKTDHAAASVNRMIADYGTFFKTKQGMFRGEKKTFEPRAGYFEDPSKMGNTQVATTVGEKLCGFNDRLKSYLKDVFSVEATNSAGANRVELVVDGVSFGKLTALELMRLKSFLTGKDLDTVYQNIPVRSDSENWTPSTDPEYAGREVYQTDMVKGVTRTTENEEVILKDPNLDPAHLPSNYQAKVTVKRKTVETGDYTQQRFTGEWSQRQKAELLRRKSQVLEAVIEALKKVNDVEVQKPSLNVDSIVDYITEGSVESYSTRD